MYKGTQGLKWSEFIRTAQFKVTEFISFFSFDTSST